MKLPVALVFAASTTVAVAAIATSCSDDPCQLHCVLAPPPTNDAGVAIDGAPVTCPACADPVTFTCPTGCEPIG